MVNYDPIKNNELRDLVAASESIRSMKENEIQQWVENIAALPAEAQEEMVKVLREEQEQIRKEKQAKGITPETEQAELEQKMRKIYAIKKNFEAVVRKEHEKNESAQADTAAETLLKKL